MKRNISSTCTCCGKNLTDPISIEIGMGPICRIDLKTKEAAEKTANIFAHRSDFDYRIDGKIIAIEDLGGYKSVTNDLENVLVDIMASENIKITDMKSKYLIIYRDSMGIWDGVDIKTGNIQFYSLNERIYGAAKTKALTNFKKEGV